MSGLFATGKYAHGFCDRCGFRCKYSELRTLTVNEQVTNTKVCPTCWEPDHPQYRVGKLRVVDAQALRDPRPDPSLDESRGT